MSPLLLLLLQDFRTTLPEHDLRVRVLGPELPRAAPVAPPGEPERVEGLLDCVVVGGGLAGLGAAVVLRDREILVLERDAALPLLGLSEEGVPYPRGPASHAPPAERAREAYRALGLPPLEETRVPGPVLDVWRAPADLRAFRARLEREREDRPELDRLPASAFAEPYGPEVLAHVDAFCRSVLGAPAERVSALAVARLYPAELGERHAWPGGNSQAEALLRRRLKDVVKASALVVRVAADAAGVDVDVLLDGRYRRLRARHAILALPWRELEPICADLPDERRSLLRGLEYVDVVTHQIFSAKEIRTPSFILRFPGRGVSELTAARWMESKAFSAPVPGPGILTLRQPLPRRRGPLEAREVNDLAQKALRELYDVLPELRKEAAISMESYRQPAALLLRRPGYFTDAAPRLNRPLGRLRFAHEDMGAPTFEEAVYRGHRAGVEVLDALGAPRD